MIEGVATTRRLAATKILILITEDWFALSHFTAMLRALTEAGCEVVVATNISAAAAALQALGVRVIAFDFARASNDPLKQIKLTRSLRLLIEQVRPDIVHAIALKPIVLGGLSRLFAPRSAQRPKLVMHLTGVGYAGTANGLTRIAYNSALTLMTFLATLPGSVLMVENPDDAAAVLGKDWASRPNVVVLGGAGVDPATFPAMPLPTDEPPAAGFVGRMIWSKGVDVLVEAHQILHARRTKLRLRLGGAPDPDNPRSLSQQQLAEWGRIPGVECLGRISAVPAFWRDTSFAVVPSRGGEGLPRSLLEAASCSRPLIVSDVPGCRHFVRHEIEGLIVPAEDPLALADALERLIRCPGLAIALGERARERVGLGFSEGQMANTVVATYDRLLASG